jgi:Pyruvate/2-oxoacid:ferredoxin oxidoreductase gamma subunit
VATKLGNYRAANTVLFGAMAETGIGDEHWVAVMKQCISLKILGLNMRAFEKGRALAIGSHHIASR